ncbi:MAG: hypothetical protein OHK0053_25770 [Microscillaceae bacterium]
MPATFLTRAAWVLGFMILFYCSACVPPRCKIPNCAVVIDHNHPKYGQEVKGKQSPYKVYRGVAWHRYIFRKKYRAKSADGRYRKIDTREAFQ